MERRVEDAHLLNPWQNLGDGLDPHDVRGVVERREGDALFQGFHDLRVEFDGSRELLPRVNDPMPHRPQLT